METAHSIWEVTDMKLPFKGVKFLECGNAMLFDIHEDTDDGTYEKVSDWKRFVTKLDKEGTAFFINKLATNKRKKTMIEAYDVTIFRKHDWDTEATIEFKEPITVVIGKVGDVEITAQVKKIRGEFDHDYFFKKNGRQHDLANGFEIWFKVNEYLG
jgi:hypothetical protein